MCERGHMSVSDMWRCEMAKGDCEDEDDDVQEDVLDDHQSLFCVRMRTHHKGWRGGGCLGSIRVTKRCKKIIIKKGF